MITIQSSEFPERLAELGSDSLTEVSSSIVYIPIFVGVENEHRLVMIFLQVSIR